MSRRSSYQKTKSNQEAFIVPNLNRAIDSFLNNLKLNSGGNVLDVGCGNQPLRIKIESLGLKYDSLDISQNDFQNVDYIQSLSEPLIPELSEKKYDLIICTEVLEHIYDWTKTFENFKNLLSEGGLIFISCPFLYPLHEIPHDYWRPTEFAIRQSAANNSLKVIQVEKIGSFYDALGLILFTSFPSRITSKSIFNSIRYRILKYFLLQIRRFLIRENWKNNIEWDTQMYVSNIAILKNE